MKNMIEVPTEKDFYRTKNVEVTTDNNGLAKVHYRDCNLAMRSITDFTSIEIEIETFDEEKRSEYEKEFEIFREKCNNGGLVHGLERPEMPTKKVKIIGTAVSYFSTLTRIIVDNFDDFEKTYFDYLKLSRLDLQN